MQPDHRFLDDLSETSSRVEPALVVDDAEGLAWDENCDVLVVGVGLAGACATLRTAEDRKLQVIAVDRGLGGGASRISGGVVYMGGGTRAQREAGLRDTPEDMANYLMLETGDIVRPDTVRRFARASTGFQDWLESHGARFGGPATEAKTSYPDDGTIYYSGNELTPAGRARAPAVQRGHRAKPPKGGEPTKLSGHYLLPPLLASIKRQPNVRFYSQTRAQRMIVDRHGDIVGMEVLRIPAGFAARLHAIAWELGTNFVIGGMGLAGSLHAAAVKIEQTRAKLVRIRVRKGVVLAAGGFIQNRAMMAKLAPAYLPAYAMGTIADDGSGIKLGMTVGATVDRLERISAWKFLYPPASWTKACSVGPDGERLVGEEYYGSRTGEAVFQKGGGKGWLILDQPLQDMVLAEVNAMKKMAFQKVQFNATMKNYTVSAATLPELAARIGVPAENLVRTIATYNQHVTSGVPDPLGKSEHLRRTLDTGPFYATDIGGALKLSPTSTLTMGGLVVDEDTGQVLANDGGVVKGLYAAGRTAVGICSHYYVSGLSLGDCVWSGLRAAETIKGNGGAAALAP